LTFPTELDGGDIVTNVIEQVQTILQRERSFVDFLLDFWAITAIALMLVIWIVLALADKRLRAWVVPTFAFIAIVVNVLMLWIS
jgi:hypothetical protein